MTVADFIVSLGGATKVSQELRLPFTTVASWGHVDNIPKWRLGALAELAAQQGKSIPPELTQRRPSQRKRKGEAA